uniref:Retrovirus-related Pol polyprotein from transposon TNT 1-94 n=1 Tax=Tanacetum cinerariifolium TaxID=118510 RepID=A0A6L2KV41_TANCI|nr:retrovirus-related Pol polyprotein from transposon TNT 1-94 [Tanacetum cinerariifolium]
MNVASSVRRSMKIDLHDKNNVLANFKNSTKIVAVYVRKNKQTDNTFTNVISNKENVIDVDVVNASKVKNLLCVSCMQNVLILCHDKCLAHHRLNASRTLTTKSRKPKSSATAYVILKTRLDLVDGLLKFKYEKDHLCSACERGKSKKASHPPKLVSSDNSKLELLHMDLCGLMRVASINGKKYILVILDDYSRFTWVYFLHSKDETPEIIKKFIAQAELNYKAKVCKIHTDNGTECKNATLKAHYEKLGIMQQFLTARTPQQNGVVGYRLFYSYLSIIHTRYNKTPYELLRGRKPNVEYFHVFGSLCYLINDRADLGKMKPKADIRVFIEPMNTPSKEDLDNLFGPMFEEYFGKKSSDTHINYAAQLTQFHEDLPSISSINIDEHEAPLIETTSDEHTSPIYLKEPDKLHQEDSADFDGNSQFVSYNSTSYEAIDSSSTALEPSNVQNIHQVQPSTHSWIKYHPLDQVIGDPSKSIMTRQRLHTDSEVCMYVLTISTIKPKNIKEAMVDHNWIESMQDELNQFERLQVWELVPKPKGKNIIALKWLWENKCDAENNVVRNKTHLVAKGTGRKKALISKSHLLMLLVLRPSGCLFLMLLIRISPSFKWMSKQIFLKKHGLDECVSMSTPMATERLNADLQGTPTDQTTYRRMIGRLMYLTASRPDVAYATFMRTMQDVKMIVKAHQEDFIWMRTQLLHYGYKYNWILMYSDSKSAIAISCNPVQHSKTKHINIRYHFIKEHVEKGTVKIYFVGKKYHLADLFTKALPKECFEYLVHCIVIIMAHQQLVADVHPDKLCPPNKSSLRLTRDQSSNSTSSMNTTPKGRNRRSSKQRVKSSNLEEHLHPVVTMANNRTMAEMLCAPTEGDVPNSVIKLILFPFSLAGAARRTTTLRNEISNFQQRFDESFHEAWDRYKDLLRACPHRDFTKMHQLDTFYNALNPADQYSLNAAAGGNLLERSTQDVLTIIENKSKVCNSRSKPLVSQVKACDVNSNYEIAKLTHAVNQQTSDVTTAMTAMLKKFQATPPPAPVKAVEEICVTSGGAHPYYQCLAAGGNTFPEFRDNIQGYVLAAAVNYNQGNPCYRPQGIANQIRPPGFAQPNVQNNQNRFGPPQGFNRGNNFNHEQSYQAIAQQNQNFHFNVLEKIKRMNEVNMKAMQTQIDMVKKKLRTEMKSSIQTSLSNQTNEIKNMMANLLQMNTASTSGSGYLPSNNVANPKGKLKAITTRSGLVTDGPTIPTHPKSSTPEVDERVEETSRTQISLNIPSRSHLLLSVILKKLLEKLGDPGKFLISCGFSKLNCKALADLGTSINLMPLSLWKELGLPELIPTHITLELANRAICTPAGISRDVFVLVGKFTFPAYFVIVDYESDPRVPLILGRPFLRTAHALIDVHGEKMILRDGDERLTLNMRHDTSSNSNQPQKESINLINIFNVSSKDFLEFDIESDLKEIEFLLYQDKDSSLKDSIDQKGLANLDAIFVDPIPEMFTDEHTLNYSSPLIFDGEKIKESKLLIDELDLHCGFLPPFEYDSFISQDFSRVDALPSTNNEDKVFNPCILIQEKPVKIINRVAQDKKLAISNASLVLKDFDPPFYEPLFFKDVPNSKMLLPFSSANEENVFKLGIYTSKKTPSSFKTTGLLQPWQTLCKIFSKCLTTLVTGWDQPPVQIMQMLYCFINNIHVDYAELLWEGICYSFLYSTSSIPYPRFTKIIIGHYMTNFPEISRRARDKYQNLKDDDLMKNIFNLGRYKDKVGIKIPDWMISKEMKQTEHYQMYAGVFGIDVPLIHSPLTESTQGTHRKPSALRQEQEARENVALVEKHLASEEIEKMEKGQNVEETRITPFHTPIGSSRIHTDLVSSDTEKLQELTELQGHYGYLFEHLRAKFMLRKSFVTLADHLHEAMSDSLSTMVDKHIKQQVEKQVPEEKSAKRQKTSEYETYVFRESSSGQDNKQEQGPSTSERSRSSSTISDQSRFLYLKKGNLGPKKIVSSLHKLPAVVFNDDDIKERTSIWVNKKQKEPGKPKEVIYSNSKIVQVIKTYWELGHEHKFITKIISRRANDCIVSITEPNFKNLNKNDIEDMYLLIMKEKVPDYAEQGCYGPYQYLSEVR